jgi:molybdopterin molybdotransferase
MLTVDEALQLVLHHAQALPPAPTPLAGALGRVLAEPIVSDIDSPPHDKSIVDGYAVIAADITAPGVELIVLEEITAGAVPTRTVERGAASRIMTGAPLPPGADSVVMTEHTLAAGQRVAIMQTTVKPGQNIMPRAAAMSRGQTILQPGKLLRAIELGLLAEVGRGNVAAIARPTISVAPTGNELVDHTMTPSLSQIRNSNGPMLVALASQAGAVAHDLEIANDDPHELARILETGLADDVLVVSGGVSAGILDLVPKTLEQLGVRQIFHKVNLKPGKPLWFGVRRCGAGQQTIVFGLPGNPVSSLVCFELFVRPAIQRLSGLPPTGLPRTSARLAKDHFQRGDRPTYWPAAFHENAVRPLGWKGSGDLRTLADANCLAYFPAGDRLFHQGEPIDVLLFDGTAC